MNIVPMFLNVFIPLGIFVLTLAVVSFWVFYLKPALGWFVVGLVGFIWIISVLVALERKKNDPEPTWYIYFALILGIAFFGAIILGFEIYQDNSLPFYMIKDLKTVADVDASKERGQNVMDAGIFYFAKGNKIDAMRAWHFKQKTLYCVAPIIKGNYPAVPDTQSFDFWVVGKNCCSEAASDFRCGAYNNPLARSGIRILDDKERPFYRLAVEQAQALYGIQSSHPVFFEWTEDPLKTVQSWNNRGVDKFLMYISFAGVLALFGVSCAAAKFAWMGRVESVYGEDILGDPEYRKGGPQKQIDFHTHARTV
jgi:hypothetical protein